MCVFLSFVFFFFNIHLSLYVYVYVYIFNKKNVNEQLIIKVQMMHKVKDKTRQYLQRRLVEVTLPDKWSRNILISFDKY